MARVPRQILRSGNKYDIGAGRLGLFRCPHLGLLCSFGSARDIQKCQGYEVCKFRQVNARVDRLWQANGGSEPIGLPVAAAPALGKTGWENDNLIDTESDDFIDTSKYEADIRAGKYARRTERPKEAVKR